MSALPPIRDILKKYNIAADKKLGQNFLFDQNITDRIVRSAGNLEGKTVIEIGPGPGILTRSILASKAARVIGIEKDRRCIEALNDYLVPVSDGRLEIIDADALHSDIYDKIEGPIRIIANLPYNIATELLLKWLETPQKFENFTLMFQREVAMRIMAKPRTKDYGRLSIKAQWLCDVEHEFDLPPEAFFPPPKVTSSIINITPYKKPLAEADNKTLETLCRVVFGQRRKTLRSSLKQISDDVEGLLNKAGIDGIRRPEELSIEEFCCLARAVYK